MMTKYISKKHASLVNTLIEREVGQIESVQRKSN
jgi:hypothetical protein